MRSRKLFAMATSIVVAACAEDRGVTNPESLSPQFGIVDGAHNGGSLHFYFLPPLVPDPNTTGAFYGFLDPEVQICELLGDSCKGSPIAVFTSETGPGSETVRAVQEDKRYIVNWHTGRFDVRETVYRVRVLLNGTELGHADVQVVGTQAAARRIKEQGGIAVVDGGTLPIPFQIVGDHGVVIDPTQATLISSASELAAGVYRFRLVGSAPNIIEGDVIVGTERQGFLRRVVSTGILGNEMTVQTTQAALADIAASGSFESSVRFALATRPSVKDIHTPDKVTWGDARITYVAPGVSPAASGISLVGFDLCEQLAPGLCPPGVSLNVTAGEVTFDPDLDIGGRFGFFSLDEFHVIASGALSFNAGVSAVAARAFATSGEKTIASFSKPFLTSIGPVPVAGEVQLNFVAGFSAEASAEVSVRSGLSGGYSVELGATYENGEWNSVNNAQRSLELQAADWSASATASTKFQVRPEIRVVFYGVVGPFLALEPYLRGDGRVDIQTCRLQVLAGLDAELGIDVRILSEAVASLDADFTGPQAVLADVSCLPTAATWRLVTAGNAHTCGLLSDGSAHCWGMGQTGELGNGAKIVVARPVLVSGGHAFTALSSTHEHVCGITRSSDMYCWGWNQFRQLGAPTTDVCGVPNFPCSTVPLLVSGGTLFSSVSTGDLHTCAITSTGSAYCWGENEFGQLGVATVGETCREPNVGNPTPCSTNPVPVSGGLVFSSITTGFGHSCGLTSAGVAYCWGGNSNGQLGNGGTNRTSVPLAVQGGLTFNTVDAGDSFTCGVATTGGAYCWGGNFGGQLGNGSTADSYVPVQVAGGLVFSSVSAGGAHACGITRAGETYCWGLNDSGQLGATTAQTCSNFFGLACSTTPVRVSGALRFASISAGKHHTVAVTGDNQAYGWGNNGSGQLGDGTRVNSTTPVRVVEPQ